MKKLLSVILSLNLLILSGCSGLYSNFRELEQIRVIQTMGLDYIPGGVQLTLSSANVENEDETALCVSGSGSSISEALDHIQSNSSQDDLFLSHIKQLLIGEQSAKHGLEPCLSYICRSRDLRIDTPLFIVKDKTAKETMSGSGSGGKGISEIFQALETTESEQHNSRILRASEVINNLAKYGGALISAVEYTVSAEDSKDDEQEMTAVLSGYAVIKDSELCGYIDMENSLGADFLLNRVGIADILITDRLGRPISMEISSGGSEIKPVWEENKLKGLDVFINVKAMVLEMQEDEQLMSEELSDYLISQLESYVSSKAAYVLQMSRKLQTDFLGLAGIVNMDSPIKFRGMAESFADVLPALEIKVSVSGELCHTKDIKEGQN